MISRIFGSFELVCAEKIEADNGCGRSGSSFQIEKQKVTPPDCSMHSPPARMVLGAGVCRAIKSRRGI
jgi:hypothetical protein